MTAPPEAFPISSDPKTQNQVAGILLMRELRRIANGEPTEPERRAAIGDTHPKGGDAKQAPSLMSGGGAGTAIAQPQTPISGTS